MLQDRFFFELSTKMFVSGNYLTPVQRYVQANKLQSHWTESPDNICIDTLPLQINKNRKNLNVSKLL